MKSINRSALSIAVTLLVSVTAAQAQVVRIDEAAFNAQAGLITGRSHLNSDHPQDRLQVVQIPSGGATLALNA